MLWKEDVFCRLNWISELLKSVFCSIDFFLFLPCFPVEEKKEEKKEETEESDEDMGFGLFD